MAVKRELAPRLPGSEIGHVSRALSGCVQVDELAVVVDPLTDTVDVYPAELDKP